MPDPIPLHRAKPRLVRPAPERLHREVADMDAWLNRRRKPSALDDLRDLVADIRAEPGSHLIVGFLGFVIGAFGTVGLAYAYASWVTL